MLLNILGIYSFVMLFMMTVGSIWSNVMKDGKQMKYYVPVVVFASPILIYILISLVKGW